MFAFSLSYKVALASKLSRSFKSEVAGKSMDMDIPQHVPLEERGGGR